MKLKYVLLALCGMFMFSVAACNSGDDTPIKYNDVPTTVKQFLGKHFAGKRVKTVRVDTDDAVAEYDIVLFNGTKIDINANGDWSDISNRTIAVPTTMLPQATRAYISTNYPKEYVKKIEKDRKGYEVKLSSGVELKFDAEGNFIKIDR